MPRSGWEEASANGESDDTSPIRRRACGWGSTDESLLFLAGVRSLGGDLSLLLLVGGARLRLFLAGFLLVVFRGSVAHGMDVFGGWLSPRDGSFPGGCLNVLSHGLCVTPHSIRPRIPEFRPPARGGVSATELRVVSGCHEGFSTCFSEIRWSGGRRNDAITGRKERDGPKQPLIPRWD